MTLEILSQAAIYLSMVNYMVANQDVITDFDKGSGLDTQLNAFATQINQALVKCSGGFKSQFEQIPYQVFDFQRKTAEKASGTVVFSRQTADPVEILIPEGTKVSTPGGLLYSTQGDVSILSGATNSSAANIIADDVGQEYNVFIDKITEISSSVDGINSVTNNTACVGGKNKETNSVYFARFKNFILGLSGSNTYGIFTAAVEVDTIQSAFIEDHFPPKDNLINFTIYVDDGSGNVPQAKLDEIQLKIYGNNTSAYQGYVAAGINFDVFTAGLVPIAVAYEITIDPTATDPETATTACNLQITNYINSLWVGSDVVWSEVNKLVKSVNGIYDVVFLNLNGAEDNIINGPSQVPRVSSITPDVT